MHRLSWSTQRDEARTRLWPVPVAALVLAVTLGIALPRLDKAVDDELPASVTNYLFGGGAGAARPVLEAIATSLITVTSLTFSLTVVTLQLASSQYSPRLLRTFTRDRFIHSTLALFLGSFTYALTVLRTVRTEQQRMKTFVPQIAVTVGFLLTIACVLGLVLFLAHLAREIRVETMLQNVRQDAMETVARVLDRRPLPSTRAADALPIPPAARDVLVLVAPGSGFLVRADPQRLVDVAEAINAVVVIDKRVGDAMVEGTPIGRAWSRTSLKSLTAQHQAQLQEVLPAALQTRFERTSLQDVAYGLRQLTDVAVKALSPGINDPTTAVHALNHSAVLLCDLLRQELGPAVVRDERGSILVSVDRPRFEELLHLAVSQPRLFANTDPFVMVALFELLCAVAWTAVLPEDRDAIESELADTRRSVDRADLPTADMAQLSALHATAVSALARA